MSQDNLIFFNAWDERPIGAVIKVELKRPGEELQFTMVKIVRKATKEEYLDYCESIGIAPPVNWVAHYYAGLGD